MITEKDFCDVIALTIVSAPAIFLFLTLFINKEGR